MSSESNIHRSHGPFSSFPNTNVLDGTFPLFFFSVELFSYSDQALGKRVGQAGPTFLRGNTLLRLNSLLRNVSGSYCCKTAIWNILFTFLIGVTKFLPKPSSRRKSSLRLTVWEHSPHPQGNHGSLITPHFCSEEAWCRFALNLPLLLQSRLLAHRMVLPSTDFFCGFSP